ncbi:hypothetical protein L612_000100000170 [Rhodococcus rhodochrous J38]|jgi:hypothetical protein|nr:hypothetical protein L612_000100000170 [Rhodococcus rhodochrous J38]
MSECANAAVYGMSRSHLDLVLPQSIAATPPSSYADAYVSKRRADSVVPTRELRTVLDGIRLIETSPFDTAAARTCSYCIHILVKGALWPLPS